MSVPGATICLASMKGFLEAARGSDLILLSRARILRAALAIVDRQGPDALTIRRLASRVRQPPMNLYFWFRDKEDVVDQMVDAVFAAVPSRLEYLQGPWRRRSGEAFTLLRSALRAHPGAIQFLHGRRAPGPNYARTEKLLLRILRSGGLSEIAAKRLGEALTAYTLGFAFLETSVAKRRTGAPATDRAFRLGLNQLLPGPPGVKLVGAPRPRPPARQPRRSRPPSRLGAPGR
jgi:AcrR family transcriptional regulator